MFLWLTVGEYLCQVAIQKGDHHIPHMMMASLQLHGSLMNCFFWVGLAANLCSQLQAHGNGASEGPGCRFNCYLFWTSSIPLHWFCQTTHLSTYIVIVYSSCYRCKSSQMWTLNAWLKLLIIILRGPGKDVWRLFQWALEPLPLHRPPIFNFGTPSKT